MKKSLKITILTMCALAVAINPNITHAIPLSQYYTINNTGEWIDSRVKESVQCDIIEGLRGTSNLERIYHYLRDKGLNQIQAIGAVANIEQESGGDPENIQDPGGRTKNPSGITAGWGIIQWTPGNKILAIADQAKDDGYKIGAIYELFTQLEILWWHMNKTSPTGATNMLEHYKTIPNEDSRLEDAVYEFHDKIEGSADRQRGILYERVISGRNLLREAREEWETNPASANTDQPECSSGAVSGDIAKTAFNYAWPKYHSPPYVQKRDSYEQAVRTARSKGEYIGGIRYPGVDCGGFVTRVMRDSKADPEYNSSEGNTNAQLNYLAGNPKYDRITLRSHTTADLKPGDIAIRDGHTYMYVGELPGFQTRIASASLDERAPMAGREMPADPNYQWFRLVDHE